VVDNTHFFSYIINTNAEELATNDFRLVIL